MRFSIILFMIFGFYFSALCLVEKDQQIEIKLIYTGTNKVGVEQITIQKHKNIIARITTDSKGVGCISRDLLNDLSDYDLYLTSMGVMGTYLTTINAKTSGVIEIILPKTYQMKLGKAICPKCHRINNVFKAIYSDPPIRVRKIIKRDTIYSPIFKGRYYMPTDVSNEFDPHWYCKKDDLLF